MIEATLVAPGLHTISVPPAVRVLRVSVAGCGVVGSELVRLIDAHTTEIERAHGVRVEIVRVLVRQTEKARAVRTAQALFTSDVDAFLQTPADVVVEAMGGLQPAERIARAALTRGARFVTANKALIGAVGGELVALARAGRGSIDFEAAVGGGIPIVRVLRDARAETPVHRIRGILNGTSNYILTLLERGVSFEHALLEAQRNGFAEADPTRDLDGTDASDKIRILAWLAYGIPPQALAVRRRGIMPEPERLVRDAAAAGGSLRLLAECALVAEKIVASVEPVIVGRDSAFGRTTGEQNHISVDFGWSGPVALSGPGAGGLPTASALLGDILRACTPLVCAESTAITPGEENRPHAWLVSAAAGGRELCRSLAAAGLEVEAIAGGPNDDRVLVARCGWTELDLALRPVAVAGGRPLATRLDGPEERESEPRARHVVASLC